MLGELDDVIVAKIIATGATTQELAEAHAWLQCLDECRSVASERTRCSLGRHRRRDDHRGRRAGRGRKAGLNAHGALATMTVIVGGRPRFETRAFNWGFWTFKT